jgi:hypothetical protein
VYINEVAKFETRIDFEGFKFSQSHGWEFLARFILPTFKLLKERVWVLNKL